MNSDDVGKLFTIDGEDVWRMIVYCGEPTARLKNLETEKVVGGAVGSPILQPFKRLIMEVKDESNRES